MDLLGTISRLFAPTPRRTRSEQSEFASSLRAASGPDFVPGAVRSTPSRRDAPGNIGPVRPTPTGYLPTQIYDKAYASAPPRVAPRSVLATRNELYELLHGYNR